jgi:serine/threonine-protein kinase HipA
MDRVAYVYFNEVFAGTLTQSPEGFTFTYDVHYTLRGTPIGFRYPFSQVSYYSRTLFPVFENLVSEGWLLDVQSRLQHIDKKDKLGFLLNNGQDLVGAITVKKVKI